MNLVFVNECAADGCYKKRLKNKALCKTHQEKLNNGEVISAFYGKKIKRKEANGTK